ncbi:type II toxin-antitoxin system SpoIISA family toxin [Metabacillus sp. RGM 3146]|uniref:type II toxin-antitoxin system SpoIISA family toxin n=1 Tax=Metabacillus sp. RGM 3146 TaxID=3401092 RepID=UPI003B9B85E7
MIYQVFFSLLIVYILASLIFYWRNSIQFAAYLGNLRKTLYALFLISLSIGFMLGKIDFTNWQLLAILAGFMVFTDLAIYQTPNILKIWNAEFEHDDRIRKTIEKNEETLGYIGKKSNCFSQIIQESESYFSSKNPVSDHTGYMAEIASYFDQYLDSFGFKAAYFPFEEPSSQTDLREHVQSAFSLLEMRHNLSLELENREKIIQDMMDGKSLPIKEESLFAISFFGTYNMLITIKSDDVPVNGIDALNIVNMAFVFEWYMCL